MKADPLAVAIAEGEEALAPATYGPTDWLRMEARLRSLLSAARAASGRIRELESIGNAREAEIRAHMEARSDAGTRLHTIEGAADEARAEVARLRAIIEKRIVIAEACSKLKKLTDGERAGYALDAAAMRHELANGPAVVKESLNADEEDDHGR